MDYIRRHRGVTFVEIKRILSEHIRIDGDLSYELSPNVILWAGMSEDFCQIMENLRLGKKIEIRPTHFLTYIADGEGIKLPVALRPSKKGYKKPHWLPVCFYPFGI